MQLELSEAQKELIIDLLVSFDPQTDEDTDEKRALLTKLRGE